MPAHSDQDLESILGKNYIISQDDEGYLTVVVSVNSLPGSEENLKKLTFSTAQVINNQRHDDLKRILVEWRALLKNSKRKASLDNEKYLKFQKGEMSFDEVLKAVEVLPAEFIRNEQLINIQSGTKTIGNIGFAILQLSKNPFLSGKKESTVSEEKNSLYDNMLEPYIHDNFEVDDCCDSLIINIFSKPKMPDEHLANKAFQIMSPLIDRYKAKLNKIDIIWAENEGAFGKKASLAGVYMDDYKNRLIQKQQLKKYIAVSSLEPYSRKLNAVEQVTPKDVDIENIRKAKELRKLATFYMHNKNYPFAIKVFSQASHLDPNDKLSYYWMGKIYYTQMDYENARKFLEHSLAIDPEFRPADEALTEIKKVLNVRS